MIDKLRSMAIFAAVVDQGTFRGAADHLGLAPSRISQTVSKLEKELGITLLYRSTRQLSLTNEGEILYHKIGEMLQAAETGLDAINMLSTQPAGSLRVTAPAFVTQTGMMSLFGEFAKENPKVDLKFCFSDAPRDLIKEGFDVGIRAGLMEDSEMMTRNIGKTDKLLVASPDYVATQKTAKHLNDLEHWDWIHFSMRPERVEMVSAKGEVASVVCKFQVEVDSAYALYELAINGLGVTALPDNLARRGIQTGELVRVIPEWSFQPLSFQAVWPDQSRRESLALIFVRFLARNSDRL